MKTAITVPLRSRNKSVRIRPARPGDAPHIFDLLQQAAARSSVIVRSHAAIAALLPHFFVAQCSDNTIVGCIALQPLRGDLHYLRSLVVAAKYEGQRIGAQLIQACLAEAHRKQCQVVLALVRKNDYLSQFGFERISRESLLVISPVIRALFGARMWRDLWDFLTTPLFFVNLTVVEQPSAVMGWKEGLP